MNPLLLADRSPSLRLRALTELEEVAADDPEVAALRAALPASEEVRRALAAAEAGGAADQRGGRGPTSGAAGVKPLAVALCRMAYLGYDGPEVAELAERLFDRQRADGSWPLALDERAAGDGDGAGEGPSGRKTRKPRRPPARPRAESYTMIPMQTAIPLRGLASAGYATDPRAEKAYEWLLDRRLDDGAWPGDAKADLPSSLVPGYRRLKHSPGCRSNTTAVLACLAHHPERRTSAAAGQAVAHVLSHDSRQEWALGFEVARLVGVEPASGTLTYYATYDIGFVLDLAGRSGADADDDGVAALVEVVEAARGPYGLWEHPRHPQLARWLSLDLELSLRRLSADQP